MSQAEEDILRKLRVLNHARQIGNVSEACRHFGISREIFYRWKRRYEQNGRKALINCSTRPKHPRRTPPEIEKEVLHMRRTRHVGPTRIAYHLKSRHGMDVSPGTVYCILRRHGMNRLARNGD